MLSTSFAQAEVQEWTAA